MGPDSGWLTMPITFAALRGVGGTGCNSLVVMIVRVGCAYAYLLAKERSLTNFSLSFFLVLSPEARTPRARRNRLRLWRDFGKSVCARTHRGSAAQSFQRRTAPSNLGSHLLFVLIFVPLSLLVLLLSQLLLVLLFIGSSMFSIAFLVFSLLLLFFV